MGEGNRRDRVESLFNEAISLDASELAALTQQMLQQGFAEDEIRKVMGAHIVRLLLERLPDE